MGWVLIDSFKMLCIPRWAQVLKLTGDEERTFLLEAYLTHTPEYIVDVVRQRTTAH